MISISFVNGDTKELPSFDYLNIEHTIEESCNEMQDIADDYLTKYSHYMFEYAIEKKESSIDPRLVTEGENVFATIGEKVVALAKKVVEYITKLFDRITGRLIDNKSDIEKMNKYLKTINDPELRKSVFYKYQSGELDLTNLNSVKDISNAYDELVRLDRQNSNPTTFKGKANKFFANVKDKMTVQNTKTPVEVVLTVVNVALGLAKLKDVVKGTKGESGKVEKVVKNFGKSYTNKTNKTEIESTEITTEAETGDDKVKRASFMSRVHSTFLNFLSKVSSVAERIYSTVSIRLHAFVKKLEAMVKKITHKNDDANSETNPKMDKKIVDGAQDMTNKAIDGNNEQIAKTMSTIM